MQFAQIPQSLYSPFQLFLAEFCPAAAPLNLSFFASQHLSLTSGQSRLWQMLGLTSEPIVLQVCAQQLCAVSSGFLVSAPLQQNATHIPASTQACFELQLQNLSGNTWFVLIVATAVFWSGTSLLQPKTLLHSLQPQLAYQISATVLVPLRWQMTTWGPERWMVALTTVADNFRAVAKVRFSKPDNWRVKVKYCRTNKNAAAQGCKKLQLYQPDNIKRLAKMLFYAGCGGLAASFIPGILQGVNSAQKCMHCRSGFSARRSRYAAIAQSAAATAHLSQRKLSEAHQQRLPIFAVTRHQVAGQRALHQL